MVLFGESEKICLVTITDMIGAAIAHWKIEVDCRFERYAALVMKIN